MRQLARRITGRPGAVWLWSNGPCPVSYFLSDPIDVSRQLDPEPGWTTGSVWAPDPDAFQSLPRWVGILPYEAFRTGERSNCSILSDPRPKPLIVDPLWCRYGAVAVVTGAVTILADEPACVEQLSRRLASDPPEVEEAWFELQGNTHDDDALHADRINFGA